MEESDLPTSDANSIIARDDGGSIYGIVTRVRSLDASNKVLKYSVT